MLGYVVKCCVRMYEPTLYSIMSGLRWIYVESLVSQTLHCELTRRTTLNTFSTRPPSKILRRRNSTKFSFLCNIRKLYNLQVLSQFSSWAVDESYHRSGRALSMNLKLETELCANSICNKVHWMIILQHKTAMKPSNWICMWCARWIFQVATKNFHIRFYWIV